MRKETVLEVAEFDEKLVRYWMLGAQLVLLISIVTIPLMPIWLIFGWAFHRRQFDRIGATLTDRSLHIRKGVLFRVEKNVPLDRIQDLTMMEGPLLRWLGLASLHVETAGQNVGGGGGANLVGVIDAPKFRDAVLEQRDRLAAEAMGARRSAESEPVAGVASTDRSEELLTAIRDSLERIESKLGS